MWVSMAAGWLGGPSVSMTARPAMTPPILKPASSPTRNGSKVNCSSTGTVGRTDTLINAARIAASG